MTIVDGLDTASGGDVILADGDLHLTVVGHRQDVLHQSLAEAALAYDHGAVEVLQAAADNLAGRGRSSVNDDGQRYIGVLGLHTGIALDVFGSNLALGLHHEGAAGNPYVDNVDSLVHQAAAVAAQVENNTAHGWILLLEAHKSFANILGGVGGKLVELDITYIFLFAHKAGIGHVGQLDGTAGEGAFELLAVAFEKQCHRGAGLATHGSAHVGGFLAAGALAVDGHDAVARLDAGLVGRKTLVGFGDIDRIATLDDDGAHTAIFAHELKLHVLHVALGEIIGVGVH